MDGKHTMWFGTLVVILVIVLDNLGMLGLGN